MHWIHFWWPVTLQNKMSPNQLIYGFWGLLRILCVRSMQPWKQKKIGTGVPSLTCIECHGQPASDRADTGRDYLEEDIADDRWSCNGRDRPPTAYWLSRSRTQPHRSWAFGGSAPGRSGC